MSNPETFKQELKLLLSKKRYEHSLRVAEEAIKLANYYHIDKEQAYIAGLVHDIAKEFTQQENEYYINKYKIPQTSQRLLHPLVGYYYLKEKYNLEEDILLAVKYHTTGDINMNLLAKIVFIADKIEKGKTFPGIEEERLLAYQNIDKALILCLTNTKNKLEKENKPFYKKSAELLEFLQNNH